MTSAINHEYLSGKSTNIIPAEIIRINNENWIMLAKINDLTAYRDCLDSLIHRPLPFYTSAKGKNSQQSYLVNTETNVQLSDKETKKWNIVKEELSTTVKNLLIHNCLLPLGWEDMKVSSAWTVSGYEGSFHSMHDHGFSTISTIVYTDVPPFDETNSYHKPGLPYFVVHGGAVSNLSVPQQRIIELMPFEGMLVVFPSFILHGVYPQGPGLRRTLNVDFVGNLGW